MSSVDEATQTQLRNIEAQTGHSLDVGKVPADQVGHEIMSAPGSKEDLAALFRRQGREFVEEAISGLFQAVKEMRLANDG